MSRAFAREGATVHLAGRPLARLDAVAEQIRSAGRVRCGRSLPAELGSRTGPHGFRVVTLQTGGIPESIPDSIEGMDAIIDEIAGQAMLGRAATLDDVGNIAASAASEYARTMTATGLNITCGTEVG